MHLKLGLILLERKCNRDETVLGTIFVAIAEHNHASVADVHLRPSILGERINSEETSAATRAKD